MKDNYFESLGEKVLKEELSEQPEMEEEEALELSPCDGSAEYYPRAGLTGHPPPHPPQKCTFEIHILN